MSVILLGIFLSLSLVPQNSLAQPNSPTSSSMGGMKKPIEIRGQSRRLNMKLLLNNRSDAIRFVEIRKNYRREILSTHY